MRIPLPNIYSAVYCGGSPTIPLKPLSLSTNMASPEDATEVPPATLLLVGVSMSDVFVLVFVCVFVCGS